MRGVTELSGLFTHEDVTEQKMTHLRDRSILAWEQEVDRAKVALSNLHRFTGETAPPQLTVELVEEISLDLTPLERIEHLAQLLEGKI